MRLSRILAGVMLAAGVLVVSALPAAASPPGNDHFADATPTTIGFSETIDTTQATVDADDAQLVRQCGGPYDASVWYSFTTPERVGVYIDVSASGYSVGTFIATGTEGALDPIRCNEDAPEFTAQAGVTYYVLAVDDHDGVDVAAADAEGDATNGGSLTINVTEVAPAPTVAIAIDPTGRVESQSGVALVTGTYTCNDGGGIILEVDADQRHGRSEVTGHNGFFRDIGTCDGVAHVWSVRVVPTSGRFRGGRLTVTARGLSCGIFECSAGVGAVTVHLRGGG